MLRPYNIGLVRRRPRAHIVTDCPHQGDVIRVTRAAGGHFTTHAGAGDAVNETWPVVSVYGGRGGGSWRGVLHTSLRLQGTPARLHP